MSENNKETSTTSSTGNRGKSWDQVEDRELCKSWLSASSDGASDSGSPAGQFWQDITDHFNKKFEKSRKLNEKERSRNGLLCRWNHIHPRVNTFCGSLEEAKQLCKTESEDFDVLLKAKELYTITWKKEKDTEEIFKLYHCFQELNGNAKWSRHMEFKNKTKEKSTNILTETTPPPTPQTSDQEETKPSEPIVTTTNDHLPLDSDTEEEILLENDESVLRSLKRKARFYDRYLELQNKKLKLQQHMNDLEIMKVDSYSFSNPMQRKFFLFHQAKICRRAEEEHGDKFKETDANCRCHH